MISNVSLCITIFALMAAGLAANAQRADVSGSGLPWESSLNISPKLKYTTASIFGQGSVPSYKGTAYGAELEYVIGTPSFSVGPYVEYVDTKLENTGSSSAQSESLEGTFASLGIKLYTSYTYLKAGGSQLRLKDRAEGTVNNTKSLSSDGVELGAGLNYAVSKNLAVSLGLDLAYFKLEPADNPITTRHDYMSYSFVLGIRFSVPSGSKK